MAAVEYAKFRDATGCGWITGTVWTGPRICDKPVKYTVTERPGEFMPTVNGKVCGTHARPARGRGFVVEPLTVGGA
jgi:hypothetical protein